MLVTHHCYYYYYCYFHYCYYIVRYLSLSQFVHVDRQQRNIVKSDYYFELEHLIVIYSFRLFRRHRFFHRLT